MSNGGASLNQRRLQRITVVGKVISGPSHGGNTSTITLIRAINRAPESTSRGLVQCATFETLWLSMN
jgi:hypothetical protein